MGCFDLVFKGYSGKGSGSVFIPSGCVLSGVEGGNNISSNGGSKGFREANKWKPQSSPWC